MVDNKNAIEVINVKKGFKVYSDKGYTLKDKVINRNRNNYQYREILKGISFDVKKGEAIGLIGHNGCGKSTTLKLLTKIIYPDSGTININGRVSSLLELGAGFHPDMSGRENIYINASVFGMTKKEIDERVSEIIEFSELEEFIDNPVRTYSSGMYMRLAFSVAINVNADVLLIDEILGVGDVNFQSKCFNKLMEKKGEGTTIVVVSHSTAQIERICDRSIWLQDGMIRQDGIPVDVHREYMNYMCEQRKKVDDETEEKVDNEEESPKQVDDEQPEGVSVRSAVVKDEEGNKRRLFRLLDDALVEINLFSSKTIKNYYIELNVVRADGMFCYGTSSLLENIECEEWIGEKRITLALKKMNLLNGLYHIDIHVANSEGGTIFFGGNVVEFEIDSGMQERGIVYLEHEWIKG